MQPLSQAPTSRFYQRWLAADPAHGGHDSAQAQTDAWERDKAAERAGKGDGSFGMGSKIQYVPSELREV